MGATVLPVLEPERCPHCGGTTVSIKYASTFHEHTCGNLHVWRIY